MRIFNAQQSWDTAFAARAFVTTRFVLLAMAAGAVVSTAAIAFDGRQLPSSSQQVMQYGTPDEALQSGLKSYYGGQKQEALQGLEAAANQGHPLAQWKLGRMYADGDGVQENDVRAFELFTELANEYGEDQPNSRRAPFVADALVALGVYYKEGIAESAIKPNADRARQMFEFAASYFQHPKAQWHLGRMYGAGDGVQRNDRSAARWLNLSARKGHIQAQLELGEMLMAGTGDLPVMQMDGLKWLTIALEQCRASCPQYQRIQRSHEQAILSVDKGVRQLAFNQAQLWLRSRGQLSGQLANPGFDLNSSRQLP